MVQNDELYKKTVIIVGGDIVKHSRNNLFFYVHHLNVMHTVTCSSMGHNISPGKTFCAAASKQRVFKSTPSY